MKRAVGIFLVVLLLVMHAAILSARQTWAVSPANGWSKTYGGNGEDVASGLVLTSDGGYALVGYTNSSGAGSYDFWLVKTDSSGNMQWNQTYGGVSADYASALLQTSDGGYALAGYTNSSGAGNNDFWLVKTDASGNMQWNKTYGGSGNDGASALVQTSDGGYALAGTTDSFGASSFDFWLVKTDASGNMQWNKIYGGSGNDVAKALVLTSDGGYALAGYTNSSGAGSYDFWLVKTDASGVVQGDKTYGGSGNDGASALVQTSDGGYALAGYTNSSGAGGFDFWLVKTDALGAMQFDEIYSGTKDDEAYALVQTADGGYALAGLTYSFGSGNNDFWLVKTGSLGNMEWNKPYGGSGNDGASALVQTSDGGYALAGTTYSFGAGRSDFWLVKTDANGAVPEFPSTLFLAVLVAVTSLTVILAKKKSQGSVRGCEPKRALV